MTTRPKTLEIQNTQYAQAAEIGEPHSALERLFDAGKIGKITWNGAVYYEVEAAKKALAKTRTVPAGYVRAADHAIQLGRDRYDVYSIVSRKGAPACQIAIGPGKPAWYVDKAWLEKQLGVRQAPPKNDTQAQMITDLRKEVAELRETIASLARGRITRKVEKVTEETAREQGYRSALELSTEYQVPPTTIRGWASRQSVRSYRVGSKLYINVEDFERMYLKLDENRAAVQSRIYGKGRGNGREISDHAAQMMFDGD